jgi:hypothetical protein
MAKKKSKATKLTVNLPFGIGQLELQPDEAEERAAWELYVELATRIAVQPLSQEEGLIREALASLYSLFPATRQVLRQAGPAVAKSPNSFGPIAVEILNRGIRPFIGKWHTQLLAYEQSRPTSTPQQEHERTWERAPEFWAELRSLNDDMLAYSQALAAIARVKTLSR